MSVLLLHKVDVVNKIVKWKCWIFEFSAIFQQKNAFLSATFFSINFHFSGIDGMRVGYRGPRRRSQKRFEIRK